MKKIVPALISLIILLLATWIILPVISIEFLTLPILIAFVLIINIVFNIGATYKDDKLNSKIKVSIGLLLVLIIYIVGASFVSSSLFTWESKKNMIDMKEIEQFDESVPNVDMNNLVILDESDALKASEKLITEKDPTLGSIYQIGEGTLSVVGNKPYWIFPLEYRGLMKWLSNKGQIPGYLKVSATNFNDAEFVDYKFSASPSAYLGEDVKRIIYKKYKSFGLTDYSFEIDDEGKGWWVVTAYTNKTLVSTIDVIGTVIVDPITKEAKYYDVGKQPEWVDRIYSVSIFNSYIDWYGKYVNGWWNPSDVGKLTDTAGKGYVFKEGKIYFYTGLTSVGKDSATTGFVIYNPRTGKTEYNRISGSTEQKAIGLMEELVQNAGYKAKYPYLINVNGEATYFSTLKGNSGNVVGYSFASVKNYKAVAWAKTLREAQTNYSRALIREGGTNALANQSNVMDKKSGIVSRVGVINEGYYILKIKGIDTLFVINSEQFPSISLTKEGDNVEVSFIQVDNTVKVDGLDFKNQSIE